jgi:hypothetical protein
VGTAPEAWPGTIIVLVPLPLFISVPLTAEPGTMTDSGEPAVPVTRAGPREVVIEDGLSDDEVCASAAPVITMRAIVAANQKLIMSCLPGAFHKQGSLVIQWFQLGEVPRLR